MFSSLRLGSAFLITLSAVFLAVPFSACQGPATPPPLTVDRAELRRQFPQWPVDSVARLMDELPDKGQVALAMYQDSTPVFLGFERKGDTLIAVDNADQVFEIGSISKVFTSAFLAQAIAEGRVTADQPVDSLLGYTLNGNPGITLQQLANHTSGLPRIPSNLMLYLITHPHNPYQKYSPAQLNTYLTEKLDAPAEPGTTYAYSNLGAGLLGYAMTQLYDQSYEALLQRKIAEPLGMSQTTTDLTRVQDRLVGGLKPNGRPAQHWEFTDALIGTGGILSTTRDLTAFLAAQLEQEYAYMALQQQKTFSANENMDLALGWHILNQENGSAWHWHNGGTGGYRTSMAMDTARRTAAIVLTNIGSGHPASEKVDQLNFILMRHLAGTSPE